MTEREASPTEDRFARTLLAAQVGAAWAATELYENYKRPVHAFVRLRRVPDVDDVVSEIFLSAFRDLDRFEGDEAGFRGWLFTIARRRVADAWRKQSRRPRQTELSPDIDVADPGVDITAGLLDPELAAALDVLTEPQREVVLLRILADLSVDQVADATGRSVLSVKSLQHRGLRALRRHLTEHPLSDHDAIASDA